MSSERKPARRVVTGIDEEGKAGIWLDGDVPESAIFDVPDARAWGIERSLFASIELG